MIHNCFLFCYGCSWVPCLFWIVQMSTFLHKNPPGPADSSVFQHLLHNELFPAVTVWFSDPSFHTEDNWGTRAKLKGSNIHWCSRRKHDALRAGGWKLLNRIKMSTFFLFVEKKIFYPFITALWKQQKILACFLEDKLSTIYLDLQIQKVFTPRLNASYFRLEYQWIIGP